MIEESEHYMDRPKVHKSLATSLDLEPDTPRANLVTYFTKVKHVVRFLLALGPR
jgi:hypothetical protein